MWWETKKIDKQYFRIIDANLNRAREGLRVIEDAARFVVGKDVLYRKARRMRHTLDKITRAIYPELLKERNAFSDSGRRISEGARADLDAVLRANFRRVEESLRVLEEFCRLILPGTGRVCKALRYRAYTMEKDFLG